MTFTVFFILIVWVCFCCVASFCATLCSFFCLSPQCIIPCWSIKFLFVNVIVRVKNVCHFIQGFGIKWTVNILTVFSNVHRKSCSMSNKHFIMLQTWQQSMQSYIQRSVKMCQAGCHFTPVSYWPLARPCHALLTDSSQLFTVQIERQS